jgi:ABC-type multidrug transport system ATPase subunit/pSer/pThr/pTyr-binding forkhead associated (FHA) protein
MTTMLQQTVLAYQDKTQVSPTPDEFLIITYQGRETRLDLTNCLQKKITTLRIGRETDNQIVIPNPVVNFYHATLQKREDGWYIIDGQDRTQPGVYEPSTNGLLTNDKKKIDKEHKLVMGDRIHILAAGEYTVTFAYYNLEKAPTKIQSINIENKAEVNIGRNPTSDLVLPDLMVSSLHATIKLEGNQRMLIHMSHTNPTVVGNITLTKPGTRQPIKPGDTIKIGPFSIYYDGLSLKPPEGAIGLGPRIDAVNVTKNVVVRPDIKDIFNFMKPIESLKNFGAFFTGRKKTLIEKITLPIQPGEFVALVGGSGTGKSTLLKSMIGILETEAGSKILINNQDLFANFDRFRSAIGYVPQEDIIHEDLTVEQVLSYAIQLRKSASSKNRKKLIEKILDKLQLLEQRTTLVRNLSGGQKKRLNVAVELAANPSILVLDEPTSGLDPGLDKELMNELARLAHEELKTIILVTHTTENIEKCDKIAFLSPGNKKIQGGRLAFYGSPGEAIDFFQVEKFPDIYSKLNNEALNNPDFWPEKYKTSQYYQQHIKAYAQPPLLPEQSQKQEKSYRFDIQENLRQILILSLRYIQNNALTLVMLLLMPVFLTLLFYIVADKASYQDVIYDAKYFPITQKTADLIYLNLFDIERVLFMLSTIAVFLGLFGSFQEIVKERSIYERERLVNLSIPAYVFSKFLVLAILALFQAILMVFTLDFRVDIIKEGTSWIGAHWEAVIGLWLVITSAMTLGLLVSALVNRKRDRTIIILVFLVTLQILFAGAIFPLIKDKVDREKPNNLSPLTWITSTRWGTEAIGSAVGIKRDQKDANVQKMVINANDRLNMFYGNFVFMLERWGILVLFNILFLSLTILTLWLQDTVRKRTQQSKSKVKLPEKSERQYK